MKHSMNPIDYKMLIIFTIIHRTPVDPSGKHCIFYNLAL